MLGAVGSTGTASSTTVTSAGNTRASSSRARRICPADVTSLIDPNLFRAAHPCLRTDGGVVILISSVAGLRGCPNSVAYQAVKGALPQLARALAMDHANVVAPGVIRTDFHSAMTEATRLHNITNRIPMRREGTVEDVSSLMMEMIRNDFITGEVFAVDGGTSMRVTG